ncbi:MAG: translocation/assembly module TamB [Tannerella sp.]|jgi:hypothetical protein|nr:translocation/assembly module TamB [Tannerella sp.]
MLNTDVSIDNVNIKWLYRANLNNVTVYDRSHIPALTADNITVGFELLPLLKSKIVLTTVRLFDFDINISKPAPHSDLNIKHIIDALSQNANPESTANLQINSILLRKGTFGYDVGNVSKTITDIRGGLSLRHYSRDSIDIRINSLGFNDISGLTANNITAVLTGKPDSLHLADLVVRMPHSTLKIPEASITGAIQNIDGAALNITVAPSIITPSDLASLVPQLGSLPNKFNLSGNINGFINNLSINDVKLKYGENTTFNGSLQIHGLAANDDRMYIKGNVRHSATSTNELKHICQSVAGFVLPEHIAKLGLLTFAGEISGYTDNMTASGNLNTPVGKIDIDMEIKRHADTLLMMQGSVNSDELQLNRLLVDGSDFGNAAFNAAIDFQQTVNHPFTCTVNARISHFDYHGYNYSNIFLSGKFKKDEFEGLVNIADENIKLNAQGLFSRAGERPEFDFSADIRDFRPVQLHLADRSDRPNPEIALNVNANFTGNNPDNFNGYIRFDSVALSASADRFVINNLDIESIVTDTLRKRLVITSDVLNGEMNGTFSYRSLANEMQNIIATYLPALSPAIKPIEDSPTVTSFNFDFTLNNTENISSALKLPVVFTGQSQIKGHYNNLENSFGANVNIPGFRFAGASFADGHLNIENTDNAVNIHLNATHRNKNNLHNYLQLNAFIQNNTVNTGLMWTNDKDERYEAALTAQTTFDNFKTDDGKPVLRTKITVPESQIILKDTLWNINPTSVTVVGDKITINNLKIENHTQSLLINGIIADNSRDTININLKNIELAYVFDILNIPVLQFGGRASGNVKGRDMLDSRMIEGQIEVDNFAFNQVVQGYLSLWGNWDDDREGILLVGSFYRNDSVFTDVEGYIFPAGKTPGLDLTFDANDVDVAFVQQYMKAFASNVGGRGFGKVRLHGSFSDVAVTGKPVVKDASMRINLLNTTYSFSDSIYLDSLSIKASNTKIYDRDGNSADINLLLKHRYFRDIGYDISLNTDKIFVYDFSPAVNPQIYGQVYVGGTANINGNDDDITVNGNVSSKSGTSAGFNFSTSSTAGNYDFVSFVPQRDSVTPHNIDDDITQSPGMDYQLNFNVEVTPNATIEMITDGTQGDKLRGNGNGNIEVKYGNRTDFHMFGNYLISNGAFTFNLQQMINRKFDIRDGSTVSFRGDPMAANVNVTAAYKLSANIQDLDESLILETANPSIPVNCILHLNGRLQNPAISFDIELPNSNAELERQVRSYIDTEDMMTRQIIYLLILNKFYTPDYSRNLYTTDQFSAIASSALSAQLSNILSNLSDKVQVGASIRSRQDGIKDTEVEMLLSSQLLNNRLLFNGNFGYKDNYIQSNVFIGEFDLEYKLTRTGDISLKAYNHANDLYRYNSKSLTRQGVGLMYRKDFSTLSELFKIK